NVLAAPCGSMHCDYPDKIRLSDDGPVAPKNASASTRRGLRRHAMSQSARRRWRLAFPTPFLAWQFPLPESPTSLSRMGAAESEILPLAEASGRLVHWRTPNRTSADAPNDDANIFLDPRQSPKSAWATKNGRAAQRANEQARNRLPNCSIRQL